MNSYDRNIKLYQLTNNDSNLLYLIDCYKKLDTSFEPALSSYVNIEKYAKKLLENAYISILEADNSFVGLMAVYINDKENKIAFMSSLGVLDNYKGQGFSQILMTHGIDISRQAGMKTVKFEVKSSYTRAIKFHEKMGFKRCEDQDENGSSIYMYQDI